ncbi:MAG TPA: carbon-nitrogen hydrolase family protein [Pyrinomonadaceae bacterium]|nr:carbon-nitrogen hydrolase family protein [Pyrinomonadaceae bacterium]
MKVAAYQAPHQAIHSSEILKLIRKQIDWCEVNDVELLCCPEAVLGGLADYSSEPAKFAFNVESDQLKQVLEPLTNARVSTIVGFTEVDEGGRLYNSAALFHKGSVAGIYRKNHPFINKSIYQAGDGAPIFTIGGLTFGILICLDSNYPQPAKTMVAKGATTLFIPTNNGLPKEKRAAELVSEARKADVTLAKENSVYIVRADIAGRSNGFVSFGSSEIVDPRGTVLQAAREMRSQLLVTTL